MRLMVPSAWPEGEGAIGSGLAWTSGHPLWLDRLREVLTLTAVGHNRGQLSRVNRADTQTGGSMECRSRRLPWGVIPLFSLLVGSAAAAAAALDRYAGTFSGSGTI